MFPHDLRHSWSLNEMSSLFHTLNHNPASAGLKTIMIKSTIKIMIHP